MDNDKQIKKTVSSKEVFLRSELKPPERNLYVLEEQFAKTRRNKNYLVWLTTLLVLVVIALGTIIMSQRIARQTENIPVDINEFSDVNLQDVLDQAKSLEHQMELKRQELAALMSAKDLARDEVFEEFKKKREIVNVEVPSEKERKNQLKTLDAEQAARLKTIDDEFDPQIAQKEKEIELLQEQLNQYDGRRLAEARAREEILNSQRIKYENEKKQLIAQYEKQLESYRLAEEQKANTLAELEGDLMDALDDKSRAAITALYLKYNPILDDDALTAVLLENSEVPEARIPDYDRILSEENILERSEYSELVDNMQATVMLLETLKSVPYENTVPEIIRSIEALAMELVDSYNAYLTNAVVRVLQKRATIAEREATIEERENTIAERDGTILEKEQAIASADAALRSEQSEREADRVEFDNQLKTIREEIDELLAAQASEYEEREAKLETYLRAFLFALDDLSRSDREHGYIIDPRHNDHILLYLNKGIAVEEGDTAFVFRSDEEYIGMIEFSTKNDVVTANVLELNSREIPIKPFDKILIDKRAGDM